MMASVSSDERAARYDGIWILWRLMKNCARELRPSRSIPPSRIHDLSSPSSVTSSLKSGPSHPGTYPVSDPGLDRPPEPPGLWQDSQRNLATSSRPLAAAGSAIAPEREAAMK